MASVAEPDPTWLVLVRDVSRSIRVREQPQLMAALVLDVSTGLVRGLAVAPTDAEALTEAFQAALANPAGPLPPARPQRVLCGTGLAAPVARSLEALSASTRSPPVAEVEPGLEAEDIFDSFIGHMSGRTQPEEHPAPEDWQLLFNQALRFCRAEPWIRWSDDIDLALETSVDGESSRYVAVVMGAMGVQRGLALYPGEVAPPGLRDGPAHQPPTVRPGTLLCILDPPADLPVEFTAKAHRYDWPAGADLVPVFVTVGPEEGGDIGLADVKRFTVAIAAVVAHDGRGPILADPETQVTTGTVALGDGQRATFTIRQFS